MKLEDIGILDLRLLQAFSDAIQDVKVAYEIGEDKEKQMIGEMSPVECWEVTSELADRIIERARKKLEGIPHFEECINYLQDMAQPIRDKLQANKMGG